jgi:oligopeptide transport system substrate-binding protein
MRASFWTFWFALLAALIGCSNNPYPGADSDKKILYTSFSEPPKTLDPAVSYNTNEHVFTAQVMDTLLEYHYLERPYRLIPGLAEEVPHPESLDGTRVRYRFRLRDGLAFQDDPCFTLSQGSERGRKIVAMDVAFELMRLADPAVNSPIYESFLLVEGFAEFHDALASRRKSDPAFGERPVHEQYAQIGLPKGITLPDPLALELVLAQPYPQILYWFAMQFTTPVPWEAVEYYDGEAGRDVLAEHPIASGPFYISHYDKRAKITLEKNPNWYGVAHPEWNAPAAIYPAAGETRDQEEGNLDTDAVGKTLPFIDRIEFRLDKEAIPRFGTFLQGYYDVAAVISESFEMVIQQDGLSPEMQAMGAGLRKSVVPDIRYIAFNQSDPVVGQAAGERSRKLRQAMSLVIDVREFTRIFANSRGIPAQSPLPPGIFGYDETYKNPFRDKVDLQRAKKLLEEAGYPGGIDPKTQKPLRLTFDTGNTSPSALLQYEYFVRSWRELGIDVVVDATSYNQFQDKIRRNAYQLFLWGWVGDYPDPENFLFLLWGNSAPHPNTAQFKNAEYDELFVEMKARQNDEERLRLIRRMLTILETERPWIELYHSEEYALIHSWVKNVKPAGLSLPALKYRDIDPHERERKRAEWNAPVLWPVFLIGFVIAVALVPGVITFFKERQ